MSFVSTQFKCQTIIFDAETELFQVLPLHATVDLRAIAIKGHSAFSKAPALLEPHHPIV